MPTSTGFPVFFYLTCMALVAGLVQGWSRRRTGWGLPAMAVMGTTAVWYVGDALYNDYQEYIITLGTDALDAAWMQTFIFIVSFCGWMPLMHDLINGSIKQRGSMMLRYFETNRLQHPEVQRRISKAATGLFIAWGLLTAVALVKVDGDALALFAPYITGYKADPWGRDRVGGGFSAIISLATYLQVFLAAGAGVVAAVARKPLTRSIAIVICFLTLPSYIFDRTRNTMLATVLPGLLAWIFLRLRGGIVVKLAVLCIAFMGINAWFSFVMANRTDMSIANAVRSGEAHETGNTKHQGLNMFEELTWVSFLIDKGTYNPNFGSRYFAELVNPIPRVLWKNKPMIGMDYAKARGLGGADDSSGGVFASVSTGMIGQGVVNFGVFFGPVAAAALMAAWSALVARQDLLGSDPARLLLYATGMTLTFNMGRDITLLVLYPFLFGLLLLKVWYFFRKDEHLMQRSVGKPRRNKVRRKGVKVPWHVEEAMAPPENSHDGPVEVSERRL